MSVIECLHKVAVAESHRPGAVLWAELRDALAAELARAREPRPIAAAAAASLPPPSATANDLGVGVAITEAMVEAGLVASYAHARPAPTTGTSSQIAEAMREAERGQMRAALAAALEAGGFVVE